MIILIEGIDRSEFCKPKAKDVDKRRFFETRGMIYRVYPEQLTRVRIKKFGKQMGTDSMIVYPENCIHAVHERGIRITLDKMLADMDEYKIMTGGTLGKKPWGILSSETQNKLRPLFPFMVIGVVLLYAFLTNGGL